MRCGRLPSRSDVNKLVYKVNIIHYVYIHIIDILYINIYKHIYIYIYNYIYSLILLLYMQKFKDSSGWPSTASPIGHDSMLKQFRFNISC